MDQVDSVLEQYPINFESNGKELKLTKHNLEQLTQRVDIAEVQEYINSLMKTNYLQKRVKLRLLIC